jgi:hypothetical protein
VLRLEVVSPQGQQTVREGDSTITVEVPNAAPGRWQYTAVAKKVPYENFPFLLTVGEAGGLSHGPTPPPTGPVAATVQFKEVPLVAVTRSRPGPPRIGVTKPDFDDMGKLLLKLGEGYRYEEVSDDDLINPPSLDRFDIIFLTCKPWPKEWAESTTVKGGRENVVLGKVRPEFKKKLVETLQRFVTRGGTLYASDFRAEMVYDAFEDRYPRLKGKLPILTEVEAAERDWIQLMAPEAKVGAVAETLRKAGLSKDVQDNFDLILAVVESSGLLDGGLGGARDNAARMVGEALNKVLSPPVADEDVKGIARALANWEKTIRDGYDDRFRTREGRRKLDQERPALEEARSRLRRLRDRIRNPVRGLGPQTVNAQVVDPGLREALGQSSIPLNFNQNDWFPARFFGDGVTVFIEGEFEPTSGETIKLPPRGRPGAGGPPRSTSRGTVKRPAARGPEGEDGRPPAPRDLVKAPLLVKFPEGKGTVIFTSFHNETVNSEIETKLLRYLVFTAVTAKEEAEVDKPLLSGGFSPAKRTQLSHSAGNPSVPGTHRTTRPGPLRFALTVAGAGARLRFTLVAPNG